ncbi:MAG: GNAT family N-acetyltransferase [Rhodospirillales bacterium]|nr:GNAT family N-acetyltransferase [Rhodospirillales bacterium]
MAVVHAAAFPAAEAWREADFAAQLALPGVFGLIDPRGGTVLARIAGGEGEILTLGVAPAMRRRGLARALMRAALAEATARGAGTMFLEVAADNAAAVALYAGLGFAAVGRRAGYYGTGRDALAMRRDLPA